MNTDNELAEEFSKHLNSRLLTKEQVIPVLLDLISRAKEKADKQASEIRDALERLRDEIFNSCKVVYWPADGSYPYEHNLKAGKNMRETIVHVLTKATK